jgi:hypothetical protein
LQVGVAHVSAAGSRNPTASNAWVSVVTTLTGQAAWNRFWSGVSCRLLALFAPSLSFQQVELLGSAGY